MSYNSRLIPQVCHPHVAVTALTQGCRIHRISKLLLFCLLSERSMAHEILCQCDFWWQLHNTKEFLHHILWGHTSNIFKKPTTISDLPNTQWWAGSYNNNKSLFSREDSELVKRFYYLTPFNPSFWTPNFVSEPVLIPVVSELWKGSRIHLSHFTWYFLLSRFKFHNRF